MCSTAVLISDKSQQRAQNLAPAVDADSIRAQLERVLASELFQHSRRYPALLRHVVERTLDGRVNELKERTLGVTVFRKNPEYDTSADPVVRTTASEIRKRLEEYYSDPNHAGELRITLPAGAYIPEFHLANENRPQLPTHGFWNTWISHWRAWAIAGTILVAGLGVTNGIYSDGAALRKFWKPFLNADPVLVVVETWIGVPKPSSSQSSSGVQELIDPKSFLVLNEINSKMAAYFSVNRRTLEYELARNVTLAKLRTRPFVLRGAFNNPLTQKAVSSFRYSLNMDRTSLLRQVVDRQDPSRHWDAPMGELSRDYALVARAPEPQTGQMMVVIAGLGERGTAAATEFLTNPKYMERFAAQTQAGWEHRNIEIVLETELINGDWGEPHIVAKHIW